MSSSKSSIGQDLSLPKITPRGLKYYGKVKDNIPRKEIDKFYKIILKVGLKLDKDLVVKIAGSYRRQNKTSRTII